MSKVPVFANAKDCSEQKERLSSLKEMPIPKGATNCLSGCVFVMTGTLPALKRAKAKELIEEYGGEVISSINSKTNIILKGYDEENSKKLQDAKKKGIPITDQEGLFNYIASTDPDKKYENQDENEKSDITSNIPEIKEYVDKKCDLQTNLLNYLDDSQNIEENYQTLFQIIENQNISKTKAELTDLIQLINKISINHHRFPNFFNKIEKILTIFTEEMKEYYSSDDLFNIFKDSKRMLLFLIQEKLITVGENFVKKIFKDKYIKESYPQYFAPEINPFKNEKWFGKKKENNKNIRYSYISFFDGEDDKMVINALEEFKAFKEPVYFNENRLIGENEDEICRLIREDHIKEFIVYINKNNLNLDSLIKKSIYETNSLLLKNQENISLIEYAAFYGSIQIFKYLQNNKVELTESLWMYAVHGQNPEIFNILEENKITLPIEITNENNEEDDDEEEEDNDDDDNQKKFENEENDVTFEDCFFEAIKCHHNEVASFIVYNYLCDIEKTNSLKYISYYLKYYNLSFNREFVINESLFLLLCKYNYCYIVELLLKNKNVDVNKIEIFVTF